MTENEEKKEEEAISFRMVSMSDARKTLGTLSRHIELTKESIVFVHHSRLAAALVPIQDLFVLDWVRSILDSKEAVPASFSEFSHGVVMARGHWSPELAETDQAERRKTLQTDRLKFLRVRKDKEKKGVLYR